MSRAVYIYPYRMDFAAAEAAIGGVLTGDGYHPINYRGEQVWKKGVGVMTAMHYIKVDWAEDHVVLSGWVQAGLGDDGFSEMAADNGVLAMAPKKSVKKTIEKIRQAIGA